MVSHSQTHRYIKCMLRQIQKTQDTMRISVQLHMEWKYYVLVSSEDIVIPQQLMTSKVRFVSSKISSRTYSMTKCDNNGIKAVYNYNNMIVSLQGAEKMYPVRLPHPDF